MDTIVCFGDSNTFGFDPKDGSRYSNKKRWSGILKEKLKSSFNVIEAGCNNRTCYSVNSESEELTGFKALPKYINEQTKYLILAVGLNDLQKFYTSTDDKTKKGLLNLINIAKNINPKIEIIIFAPSRINKNILNSYFSLLFNKDAIEKSIIMNKIYKEVAKENDYFCLDLDEIVNTSEIDGLHYLEADHEKIAETIFDRYFKFLI